MSSPGAGTYNIKVDGTSNFLTLDTRFGRLTLKPRDASNRAQDWQVTNLGGDHIKLENRAQGTFAKSFGNNDTHVLGHELGAIWNSEAGGATGKYKLKLNFSVNSTFLTGNAAGIKVLVAGNDQTWEFSTATK